MIEKTVTPKYRWGYDGGDKRDLRIDFIRGIVMFILIVVHIDFFSAYTLLGWERIGVVAGAEGFVILSGLVIGMIYGSLIQKEGLKSTLNKLFDRATMLYRVNVFVIISILILSFIPLLSAHSLMTFTDQYTKQVYELYPAADAPIQIWIAKILLLKSGPHQFQILGLYVVLLIFSPLFLWIMNSGRTALMLAGSWLLYFYNWAFPAMPTGCEFEYAFPLLTWQLIYIHGMAVGFHRKKLAGFMEGKFRKPVLIVSGILFFLFLFFTQNNPNPEMPVWAKMNLIPGDFFMDVYMKYFQKNTLGILRLVNYAAVLIFGYYLLTRYWKLFNKVLGWFFVPIGQATLYVFIIHIYFIYILSNIPVFWLGNIWINTLGHTMVLLLIWVMVKKEVLFKWIPR